MIKAPDNLPDEICCRYIDEKHNVEIGIHMVMFGWRIRAGYIGDCWCQLDYCCGNDPRMVQYMLSVCKSILEKNNCDFDIFPRQDIKPIINDPVCFIKLTELSGHGDFEMVDIPDLVKLRREIMDKIFIK